MARRVQRRFTKPTTEFREPPRIRDFPDVDSSMQTLTERFRAVKPGESLYPWARTKLVIVNGTRRWVAKDPEED